MVRLTCQSEVSRQCGGGPGWKQGFQPADLQEVGGGEGLPENKAQGMKDGNVRETSKII